MASDSKSDRNGMMKSLRTKSEVNRPPELALTLLQVLIGHAGKKKEIAVVKECDASRR
jgi:hypothetical protein